MPAARHAGNDEHGLWHGGHADEGQDHVLQRAERRVAARVLDDPTYAGYSTGHWEGDTLVVDTVSLHPDSFIEGFTPHSDAMTVKERIRFVSPGVLEDRITVTDPKALTKTWETVKTYRKASPGNDELREFACAEGLTREK
jgi:hypothetical protein